MNVITGHRLPRRTFLQGMGATVALPLLDAMVPAGTRSAAVRDETAGRTRLVAIENSLSVLII